MPTPKDDLRALVEAVRAARKAQMDGCYCGGDEEMCRPCRLVMVSESELATALLTSRAVEAVEAVLALGKARAWAKTNTVDDCEPNMWTSGMRASFRDRCRAEDAVNALADRLAGGTDADG